ncbi:MAG: enoyl-CoA hydratase/isomerase family protein [bacterium]|nr:enoyl-CoA hydratase/isomerase family protein [bacterium]
MSKIEGGLVQFGELSERVGVITLNDPEKLNAMSEDMAIEFSGLVSKISQKHKYLRVLILTGAGRAFSAGGDLKMLESKVKLGGEENRLKMLDYYKSFLCLRDIGLPLIAAINGTAIGAGLCLASSCDIRIASKQAKLGMTFARLGLHPGMGATFFLPEIMGISKATEFMLTARVIDAEEAQRVGLVSKVVDESNLMKEAEGIANDIVSCGPQAIRQLLETLRMGRTNIENSLRREAVVQAVNYASVEFTEGLRSVMEKRKANF